MSSYKPYPAYKDSGVEWLGKVPEHWVLHKLKYLARFSGGGTPSRDVAEYWGGSIPWVSPKDMKAETIHSAEELITESGLSGSTTSLVSPGQILLVVRSGILKHTIPAAINEVEVALNQDMKAIQFDSKSCESKFFLRWIQGLNHDLLQAWLKQGATVESIEQDLLAGTIVPTPPPAERHKIVSYLDREIARIDTLASKKTRFINILREKRGTLITNAVTRGIDPTAKMKVLEASWLREIPLHWQLTPLKYVAPNLTVGIVVNPSDYVTDEGLPFIYGGDITEGGIHFETSRRISNENSVKNSKTRLQAGDLVTVRVGAPGITAVVPPECEGGNCASVMHIRRGDFDSDWLCYAMNSRVVRYQVEVVQYGAAQEQFNISHAVDFLIPVPPYEEQIAIKIHLNREKLRIDTLIKKTEISLTLLKERRSALITAAVTGQIDLREAS
ncbi:type I restriction enzyme S subunit [Pseudomonas helmanticensis]|uniref:Type I restriction enzyme S subunit n=1 Tax=Pseudomonas helmanticensis TaxID=1471381 RepID=A0A4R7VCG1_9PSED|nr:restriction endonuclease subunit S [Pseudomonas helmanticensis]TDV46782.1 type I restriction enzyme S subunit [Pseudomonas helmanticensis]